MTALLEIDGLDAGYGQVRILEGISLRLETGGIAALVGANGAGKSTLLKAISGLIRIHAGRILFEGEDITRLSPDRIVDRGLLHVAEGRRIFRRQSVRDNLDLSLTGTRLTAAETARRFDRVHALFPILAERARMTAGLLSGGQQQMLTIAQALMRSPRLLMLDEPSLGLAPIIVDQVLDTVEALARDGITILLVEQMVERALNIADTGHVIQHGRIVETGPAASLLDSQALKDAYLGHA
jgi:branched-chain amino acid transport system ATP-binding protein